MGRRKIEIKAIKDDRNRSVTFLKRKGGLFKKAHELSVLCSVDVAVIIFGSNKKLYEYSSSGMPDLMNRYHYHGGPNEHKGPSDFNGGADDDGSDDENGSPPQVDGMEPHMPINFPGAPAFSHPHMRHHTPSASPPIQNGAFVPHPGHPVHRGHTPQPPHMGSRPSSRNDIRRIGPNMGHQNGPPPPHQPPQVNGYAYIPQPAIYNPQNQQQNMNHGMPQAGAQYAVYPPQQAHAHQMQSYMEDQRRSSLPPNFPPQGPQQGPPQTQRHSVSPPQPTASQLPAQPMAQMSPPPPQHQHHPMQSPPLPQHHQQQQQHQQQQHQQQQQQDEQKRQQQYHQQQQQQQNQQQQQQQQRQGSQPPPQVHVQEPLAPPNPDIKAEPSKPMRQPPLLDTQVKRLPQRKGGSIFTPIDGPSSILAQHLSAFKSVSDPSRSDGNRSHSVDVGSVSRNNPTSSPPQLPRSNAQAPNKRHESIVSIPERTFTPPSRANSLQTPGGAGRPRLKVQIPEEASEAGSATAGSSSPRNTSTDNTSQHSRGMVLPPPSPSVEGPSGILSAGATGPPNPFARPVRQEQHHSMNIDTPVSALPSRFMGDFLPSPSQFYPEWNFARGGNENNTSPLNFATPVVGTGPSFLREEPAPHKRKSPEISGNHGAGHDGADHGNEPKRIKVDS